MLEIFLMICITFTKINTMKKKNLNTKDRRYFDYKKLRPTDDYQYVSENEEEQQTSKKPTKTDVNKFNERITEKEKEINKKLFEKYFNFQMPTAMLKTLYTLNNKKKNNQLVDVISSGLRSFKEKIKDVNEKEKEIEKPYKTADIVEEILDFNEKNKNKKDMA